MAQPRVPPQHTLILIAFIIAVSVAIVVTGLAHNSFQSGITQLGHIVTENNAELFEQVIRFESESFGISVSELAASNETRDFLSKDSSGFNYVVLEKKILNKTNLSSLLLFNSTGFLRYRLDFDKKNEFIQVLSDDLGRQLLSDKLIGSSDSSSYSGLYSFENQVVLLSVHPVYIPDNPEHILGTVIAVRNLNDTLLLRLNTSLPKIVRLTASSLVKQSGNVSISSMQPQMIYNDKSGTIETACILPDLLNRPQIIAFMQIPFTSPFGKEIVVILLCVIVTGFGLFTLVIYYLFRRYFLRPLSVIGEGLDMAALSCPHDLPFHMDLPTDITPLAESANRVVSSLDEKQTSFLRSEHARKTVEIRWETLFRSAADSILIGDEDGLLICNPRFESLTGVQCESLVGTPVKDLPFFSRVGDGIITLQDIWDNPEGGGERFVWKISPCPGSVGNFCIFDAHLRFVEMNGRVLRFLIMGDITNEVRLRQEQEQAVRQIDENLGQLAALNDEIRNPLTMIAAWAELDDSPNRNKIMDGVRRINAIIDRIDNGYIASEKVRKYLQKSIDRYQNDRENQ